MIYISLRLILILLSENFIKQSFLNKTFIKMKLKSLLNTCKTFLRFNVTI